MRNILGYNNEVEFILDSEEQGSVVLDVEPLNWNEDEKTYEMDKDFRMVMRKINTKLEFTKNGYEYLRGSALAYGLNPKISVAKRGKDVNDIHEEWRQLYFSYLDMPKLKCDLKRKIAKVPFTQGGLFDQIKSRYSDSYNLVTATSADGETISDISTIKEQATGRELFRRSEGRVETGRVIVNELSGGDNDFAMAVPFQFDINSDSDFIKNITIGAEEVRFGGGDYVDGRLGSLLFLRSDRYRKRTLNGRVSVRTTRVDPGQGGVLRLEKVYYKYNTSNNRYEYIEGSKVSLGQVNVDSVGDQLTIDLVNEVVELNTDEAFTLALYGNFGDGMDYEHLDTFVEVDEDDSFPATEAKAILPHEMIDRLIEKITGEKGLLISNVLGRTDLGYQEDGEWSLLGVSSGFWARGFGLNDLADKQFNISLKDALESLHTIDPIVMGIQTIDGKEYFRLEKYEFSIQSFVGVRLGRTINGSFVHTQVSDPEEEVLEKDLFTGVKIGFEKGGNDYEEISGLWSPHGKAEYNTSYSASETNNYEKISKIRADVEGFDLARRKQATTNPDEDTPYDQDLFFRHYKRVGAQFFLRSWQDDFSEAPQGDDVYSPDTMGNLLLTLFRCLLRHGKIIATSVYKEPNNRLNWISSNCFSDFSTTLIGGTSLQEDGSVLNSELGTPFTSEFKLTFQGKVYQEMIDALEGTTEINGELVPNTNGTFEFLLEGELLKGKLIKSAINGEGKHEIALLP